MSKPAKGMTRIMVTTTFTVTFDADVETKRVDALAAGDIDLTDIIDDSEPYRLLATEGECEMEWDYAPVPSKKRNARAKEAK